MAYHNKSLFPPISEQLNSTPATEFIDLYRNTISILENRNERLGQEVNSERQNTMRFESMALKWSELAKTLQEKIQLITSDKEKEQIILRRLRGELNEMLVTQKNTLKVLSDERKRSQDLEKRVKELEEEIVDAEALQANVLKLMSKRKKTSA